MKLKTPLLPYEFKKYVWYNKENRISLMLSVIASLVMFIFFKQLYPFPNFLPDSYSYLDAAMHNLNINRWPVGYSKFLILIGFFTHSDTATTLIQYLILQTSILFTLFTVSYLLNPGKLIMRILFALLVINPLWLYVSNFISSDTLFASLSLLWFTSLLWIMYLPNLRILILHTIVLGLVFTVRYNALYYPFISILAILLIQVSIKTKFLLLVMLLTPIYLFVIYTTSKYKLTTGVAQFSSFGGWQMSSNALFMYAHMSNPTEDSVPKEFKTLHGITIKHMDSLQHVKKRPDAELGIYYLWDDKAPLKVYMAQRYAHDSIPYLTQWEMVAPLYGKYGAWLIKQHPVAYAHYYLLPNLVYYFSPPPEFLMVDNMYTDTLEPGAVKWFRYKTNKVPARSKDRKIILTQIFPTIFAMGNAAFLMGILFFLFSGRFRELNLYYKKALLIMLLLWTSNMTFSILASPIVLRYQVFPFIITLIFSGWQVAYLMKESVAEKEP